MEDLICYSFFSSPHGPATQLCPGRRGTAPFWRCPSHKFPAAKWQRFKPTGKCKVIAEYKPLPRCYCVAPSCRVRWLTMISLNFSSRFFITATRPEGRVPWAAFCFFHSLILSLWRYRIPSLTCVCKWLLFLYAIFLYIYICRYTCFGWFACFLTASDFHTKCMQLLVGLIFCKLVAISN